MIGIFVRWFLDMVDGRQAVLAYILEEMTQKANSKQKVGLCTCELNTAHLPSAHQENREAASADPTRSGLDITSTELYGISSHKRATVFLRACAQAITMAPPTPCALAQLSSHVLQVVFEALHKVIRKLPFKVLSQQLLASLPCMYFE